uniref:Xaa-Pro aminopeptidase n=1 Tax=uncultured Armatimonadetes bacterium TaxID=157466 RepID=A0A6J4IIW6_9BACT|nr:hypothetical protein AVDCRST_MAG63-1961 [uncultured Armatimonadetes bacterium]
MRVLSEAFPAEEFAARRARVLDRIGAGAQALVQGAGPVRGFEVFRQTNECFYLCGIEVPQAYLLLDGGARTTTLFLPHRDPHAGSEGDVLSAEDADEIRTQTGIDAVFGLEELGGRLRDDAAAVYTPHSPAEGRLASRDELLRSAKAVAADPWDAAPGREERLAERLRERRPGVEVRDLTPILDEMRITKSPREIEVMRRAGRLCALAVAEAMRSTRAGLFEYQVGAVADYLYSVNGARGYAYRPIIACGENIWYSHYFRNDSPLRDGELVLMDVAPDVHNYTSDIGRMWPVSGRYSPLQRELYGLVVEYHKALLRRIRPGALPGQVLAEAADDMRPVIERTPFSKPIYEQAARRLLDFKGHLSHPVGMAVHDVGNYLDRPMEPGLVFALDPQMWVPEERLYIRVEDTVAVTETGVEVLTNAAPLELDAVEAVMREDGLLQKLPPLEVA